MKQILLFLFIGNLFFLAAEDKIKEETEKLMKDMKLVYRALKDDLKRQGEFKEEDIVKLQELGEKLLKTRYPDKPEVFKEESEKLEKTLVQLKENANNFYQVTQSCQSCHKHYRSFFARMMENLFLF